MCKRSHSSFRLFDLVSPLGSVRKLVIREGGGGGTFVTLQ